MSEQPTGLIPRDWSRQPQQDDSRYRSTTLRAPSRPLVVIEQTLSELSGPVFGQDLIGDLDADLLLNGAQDGEPIGERTIVHGQVLDENGRPQPGVLVEIWQANAGGKYRHVKDPYIAALDPNFRGCGRCVTDADGRYRFRTVKPGAYPYPNGGNDWRPAHIHFSVFGHAFAQRLVTQMYFEGDPFIQRCAIVNTIKDADAIDRLVAKLDLDETIPLDTVAYRFDIVLRGRGSTPFETRPEGN